MLDTGWDSLQSLHYSLVFHKTAHLHLCTLCAVDNMSRRTQQSEVYLPAVKHQHPLLRTQVHEERMRREREVGTWSSDDQSLHGMSFVVQAVPLSFDLFSTYARGTGKKLTIDETLEQKKVVIPS
jgi:hypothetical protein